MTKQKQTHGYKAFDKNLQCQGHQFAVGKTYTHKGKIKLCASGYHFCERMADVYSYYPLDSRVCEVIAVGEVKTDGTKSVCGKLKVVRELNSDEICKLRNFGDQNSGNQNSGNQNSGNQNSGNLNSGNQNSGNQNSGDLNSGDRNSGDLNSGNWNSGSGNSGSGNSGSRNSGSGNSGNLNSGNQNSGDLNAGYFSAGAFCTETDPEVMIFDKPSGWRRNQWKNSRAYSIASRLELVCWISFDGMTDAEKNAHPKAETTGGYLKTCTYHEAWANLWATLTAEEKAEFGKLPNFDAKKFLQITGIKYKRKTK